MADRVAIGETDTPVVVVIGTSLTASASWPETLQTRLDTCTGRSIQLENLAQNGATSELGFFRLDDIVALRPTVVIIEFAINDADRKIGVSLPESRRRHETIISALQKRTPETAIYLMTTNHTVGQIRFRRTLLPAYYELYRDLAETLDVGLADLHPRWRQVDGENLPDGLHPTDAMSNEVIVPVLSDLLGRTLGHEGC
jgi:lysophospholipase L1-like esterase